MTFKEDKELLQAMQQGERAAMEEFYRRYSPRLFAVANRYLADKEDARDVLQESFIKIFSGVKNFVIKENGTLKAWATRITVNQALNFLRDKRLSFVSMEEVDVGDIPDTAENIAKLRMPVCRIDCKLAISFH